MSQYSVPPPTSRSPALLALLFSLGLANCAPAANTEPRAASSCLVRTTESRVQLENGRELYVEPRSLSYGDGRVLFLGSPIGYPDDLKQKVTVGGRTAVGALIETNGKARLVPSPTDQDTLTAPRVFHEPGAGWHVVWQRELRNSSSGEGPSTVMYSRFDGHAWSAPTVIARFDKVPLMFPLPSGLTRVGSGFALAVPVIDTVERRATVLLEQNGAWRRSLVSASSSVSYTRLGVTDSYLVLAYTGRTAAGEPALVTTRSPDGGMTWSSPTTVAKGSAIQPEIMTLGGRRMALAWVEWSMAAGSRELRLAYSSDAGANWDAPISLQSAAQDIDFSSVRLRDGRHVLLQETVQNGRKTRKIGVLSANSMTWTAADSVWPTGNVPTLAEGRNGELFAAWVIAIHEGAGSFRPRLGFAKLELDCRD